MRSATSFALIAALVPLVAGHGQILKVVAGGETNTAPNIYYDGAPENKKTAIRKMYRASSPAYILPSGFTDANAMACEGASGAPVTLSVKAGSKVTVYWEGATSEIKGAGGVSSYNPWVHSIGTVMDYIAPCKGDCSTTNAADLGWTKIAEAGLDTSKSISDDLRTRMQNKPEKYYPLASQGKGLWAMAQLVQSGSKWDITVPPTLANGNYIVRHELAALHNPKNSNPTSGPQLYVGCFQIAVTGGGSATLPAGTKANKLYDPNGDFANYNVYSSKMYDFKLPGPAVWDGASSGSGSGSGGAVASPSSSKLNPAPTPSTTSSKAAATTSSAPAAVATSDKPAATTTPSSTPAATTSSTPAATSTPTSDVTSATSTTLSAPSASATRKCRRRPTALKNGKRAHKRRLAGQGH